jgi:arylsulfatase A-like enzyme
MKFARLAAAAALAATFALPASAGPRNIVIFVADGLRYTSVTPETAPAMAKVRREGVDFTNSHSTYPTLTTVNAAVIATGHFPGDTGNYGNSMWVNFPVPCRQGATVTFVEDDCILRDVKVHYPNDYITQTTIIEAARKAGFNTVVIGKKGPAAIQFLPALDSKNESVEGPLGLFIDDSTGTPANPDGSPTKSTLLGKALAADIAKAAAGIAAPPLSGTPNIVQQAWLRQTVTQVVIPRLQESGKPFAVLYWSRDPDTTQHGALDSDGNLVPGINSTSGRAAIANADADLKGILETLKQYGLDASTDVFVTADHGFSTIAKALPTADGRVGRPALAAGFVALDISTWLGQKLFDPDREGAEVDAASGEHPVQSNGLIGPSPDAPQVIVVGNGGTDFIYVPTGDRALAAKVFAKLVEQPYVGGLFVNDALLNAGPKSDFAGALPMSAINMIGSSKMPQPAIVVALRNFLIGGCQEAEPQMCQAEIADTGLHQGQGMHGSFGRGDTRNFMAAIGPDFKKGYADKAPVGNVDIAPTLAHLLGLDLTGAGTLKGRVIEEALAGGKEPKVENHTLASDNAANGFHTLLNEQQVGTTKYFDAAGMPGRTVGLVEK